MKSLTLPPATVGGAAALRPGFSLIELLIAATIGLVVMGAVASLFGIFGRSASETQSIVDMTNRLRGTALKLRQDLRGITCSVTPSLSPESDAGYFELIEGPASDSVDAAGNPITAATPILGDTDDVLLFTTRTAGEPFEGKFDTNLILSPVAEVAWFCRPSPAVAQIVAGVSLQTLYRRQLLVVGYVGAAPFSPTNSLVSALPAAYNGYDLSLRLEPLTNLLVPNTLSDLTQRENRFLHGPQWHVAFPNTVAPATFDAASGREGEDAILTNVIGFDVRVYDPDAVPHLSGSTTIVYPNEQGYGSSPPAGFKGCFLDLGCAAPAATILSGTGNPRSRLHKISGGTATYDTWSTHSESNGVDDDGDGIVDEATNGLDDNANGLVDDPLENEVPPPYAVPLRAIEVRLRCYDPVSRQVRQTTIRQAFGK